MKTLGSDIDRRSPSRRCLRDWLLLVALVAVLWTGAPRIEAATLPILAGAAEAAADYSQAHGGEVLLIRQEGHTLLQRGDISAARRIYSGTKAFWILAALAAEEDGLLRLSSNVADLLPEWRDAPERTGTTVAQLLNFTAGLEPRFDLHANSVADRQSIALNAKQVAAPGARFIYGPAALQVFAAVLERQLQSRRETVTDYLERRVLRPMALGPQRYLRDRRGHPLLATGFTLSAADWSRIGQVVVDGGRPILPPGALAKALSGRGPNPAFGFAFWNNRARSNPAAREPDIEDVLEQPWQKQDWRGVCLCRDAPPDLVASIGSGYQRLYAIPSQKLVVVRFGNGRRFSDAEFLRRLLQR